MFANEKVWVRHSYRNSISYFVFSIRPTSLFTADMWAISFEKQTLETQLSQSNLQRLSPRSSWVIIQK